MLVIQTQRLDMVAATFEHLCAELDNREQLESLLGAAIPADWPPGEYDRAAVAFFRDRLAETPCAAGWFTWYAIERATSHRVARVVGAGGYYGPPNGGSVEVGYSIVGGCRNRGFATELVGALLERALSQSGVRRVIACVNSENGASIRVLDRCGFVLAGEGQEPRTLRYVFEGRVSQ
jgi:[ribosomal protein S5]-alanine N-acetyltransferase